MHRVGFLILFACVIASGQPVDPGPISLPGMPSARATDERDAKVRVSASPSRRRVEAGGAVAIAVVMHFAPGWHAWPAAGQADLPPDIDDFAIRTTIELKDPPEWLAASGPVQWPPATPAPVPDISGTGTVRVPVNQGRTVAFLPILVHTSARPGRVSLTLVFGYQACDEKVCLPPEDIEVETSFEIVAGAGDPHTTVGDFTSFENNRLDSLRPGRFVGAEAPPRTEAPLRSADGSTFFGLSLAGLGGVGGFFLLALLAAAGGFILNLTPCVLPVIPIKVLTLTKQAGTPARALVLGAWMSLGVIAFWLALGIPAAFVSTLADPSRLFGIWWLTTSIGLLIAAMGLGILGLFSINLPQAVYLVNPEAESPLGSFLFGVMTAVLGLPCFGFVAGALLPAAAAFGPTTTIVVFAAMGVGMALPYFVLAARPQWLERLPRTGPASELIKQVMGLLLLAAGAYFVGSGLVALVQDMPYVGKHLHWWAVALFATFAGLWLIGRTFAITPRTGPRLASALIGAAVAGGAVFAAWSETRQARADYEHTQAAAGRSADGSYITGAWNEYSEGLVSRALAEGKTVVMDFTAEWCLNCKALKAAVLNVAPVRPALESADVVMVRVDLTSTRAPGWEKLRSFGQTGIPLLVIQGPGLAEPWMSNAYTPQQVLDALERARKKPGES